MVKIVTETLVNSALGASGVVAWRWDIEERRMDWSPGAEDVIGLPEIVLRSPELLTRAIHPDDLPLVSQAYANALRTGGPMDARFRVVAPSGTRWFDCAGRPILDESGRAVAATGTVIDVTEEAEAEEAMLQTLHDAQLVLGDVGARMWEWDPESDAVQYVSAPTGPRLLEAEDAEGLSLEVALERLSDEEAGRVRAALHRAVATGEPVSFETTVQDDDGVMRRVFVRGGRSSASPNRLSGVSIFLD